MMELSAAKCSLGWGSAGGGDINSQSAFFFFLNQIKSEGELQWVKV